MTPALTALKLVFCSGNRQLVQRLWRPDTAHLFEFSTGSVAEGSGEIETA